MPSTDGGAQYTNNQGYRIVYGPLTTYDPVMERTVERYQATLSDGTTQEIYKYADNDYATSNVITPLITNGSDFNIYENGDIQGWSNAVVTTEKDDEGKNVFQSLSLASCPELGAGVQLIPLTELTRVQGFLELKFTGTLNSNYENTYFNSGFMDNAGIIDHISQNQKFVFRIAYATANAKLKKREDLIVPENPAIRAFVAYYEEPNGAKGYLNNDFYRQVKPQEIIMQFDGEWVKDNPTITGGTFSTTTIKDEDTGEETTVIDYKNYIINNVVQEPTTNSVYKVEGDSTEYVWDVEQAKYVVKTSSNFIDYYRTIAKAKMPVTNTKMTDPQVRIGIFLYTTDSALCAKDVYTYISDVQITKCIYDANEQPVTIGNIPTTTIVDTPTYYVKPKDGATKENTDVYYDLKGISNLLSVDVGDIKPIYNTDSEKILSISEAQSNCFNILQTICETFECWLKIKVDRDENGGILPGTKRVSFKEFAGKDNFAGFKYAINLKSIQRTLNSEEIVTKLIVDNVQSDYVDEGVMSIRNASTNPSGEAYIINLSYYINKGLIKNGQDCLDDLNKYYARMKILNNQLNEKRAQKAKLELALTGLNSNRNVFTETISAATDSYAEGMAKFEQATGMKYNDYVEKYGSVETLVTVAPIQPSDMDKTVVTIPTRKLIPLNSTSYNYEDGKYGFAKFQTAPTYADQYKIVPLGDTDEKITYVYRVFKFENGVWVQKKSWASENSEYLPPQSSGIEAVAWHAAIEHCEEDDHGAQYISDVTLEVKLDNYGYDFYNNKNYLAVQLAQVANPSVKQYILYEWDEDGTAWKAIYNSDKLPSVNDNPDYHNEWREAWGNRGYARHGETKLNNGDLTNHDAIIEIIGQLYVASSTINNYAGILSNLNKEYEELKLQIYGAADYTVTLSSADIPDENGNIYRYSRLALNDYIDGSDSFEFYFHKNNDVENDKVNYKSSVSVKAFEVSDLPEQWYSHVTITSIPKHYSLIDNQSQVININENIALPERASINYKLVADQSYKDAYPGLQGEIDELQEQKNAYEKEFYTKYSHYLKEGTWSSNDYVDAELYYLDALQTSANSAMPKVEYSIEVAEVSELEGLENYIFDVGDKTYIEDTEFFGWSDYYRNIQTHKIKYTAPAQGTEDQYEHFRQPAREEVIVSQVEWHLDEPETNVITVQNYKTRFEDLFQRLSATVQTVQYNEATYAKTSSILDENGTLNQNLLVNALDSISGSKYPLTSDGSIIINGDQITIKNLTNPQKSVKINNRGISFSGDGGVTWNEAITGDGVNVDAVHAGTLNTNEVVIGDSKNPSFRWDAYGLNAYRLRNTDEPYDLTTYVRFDQYGLYGVQNGIDYKAKSLADVKDKAQFGLTWDGFFIKNSYEGGGLVEITSDNDFRVLNDPTNQGSLQEKIKIGALEWGEGITSPNAEGATALPTLYGIRIKNDAGAEVMKTDDEGNITITGTIYANAGEIGGMSVDNDRLRMDHIVLKPGTGIYSDWGDTSSYPFIISDEDGSATFNNVTVRGAIKTSVFEYEEIQAVGGAFLFRPSSSVSKVQIDGNDLIFTAEKPLLFKVGSYVKISNYTSDSAGDTVTPDELNGYGLTYIYPIESINGKLIRLTGAAEIINDGVATLDDLAGGALIDMGNEAGTSNYGIGINSSDGFINLPPRAISLFETTVHPNQTPKISYNYRGILGTLPDERVNNLNVNSSIYQQLRGTQGIYTDNMYLGNNKSYLAYYTDNQGNKQFRIAGADIVFTYDDGHGGTTEKTLDERIEEIEAGEGADAAVLTIDSSEGNVFRDNQGSTQLTVTIFFGPNVIVNYEQLVRAFGVGAYLEWEYKDNTSAWVTLLASDPRISDNGFTVSLDAQDVYNKANFRCKLVV